MFLLIILLFAFLLNSPSTISLSCIKSEWTNTTTCIGDYCVVYAIGTLGFQHTQLCYTGIPLNTGCILNYDDTVICVCNDTENCNSPSLLSSSNVTVAPVIGCDTRYMSGPGVCAHNECRVFYTYFDEILIKDDRSCPEMSKNPGGKVQFVDDGNTLFDGLLFLDGCYNFSMGNRHWEYTCRCTKDKCNKEPATIYNEKVLCEQTIALAEPVADENKFKGTCKGDMCWLLMQPEDPWITDEDGNPPGRFHKGCVSFKETGKQRLQVGHYFLRTNDFYFCNSERCNSNRSRAMASAYEYLEYIKKNPLNITEEPEGDVSSIQTAAPLLLISLFLFHIEIF